MASPFREPAPIHTFSYIRHAARVVCSMTGHTPHARAFGWPLFALQRLQANTVRRRFPSLCPFGCVWSSVAAVSSSTVSILVTRPHQKHPGSLFQSWHLRFGFPGFGGGSLPLTRASTRSTRPTIFSAFAESRESCVMLFRSRATCRYVSAFTDASSASAERGVRGGRV